MNPRLKLAERLIETLRGLRAEALGEEDRAAPELARVAPSHRESARNLIHYLTLREHDLHDVQHELALLGLSSLGRLEPHVVPSLDAVLSALHTLAEARVAPPPPELSELEASARRLAEHTSALLGPTRAAGHRRVMVTMPSGSSDEAAIARDLITAGADVVRIDCARDDVEQWTRTIASVRRASAELGRPVKILCELAGPSLRTGPIAPGPEVVHWTPRHDELGSVVQPARVLLSVRPVQVDRSTTNLVIEPGLLEGLREGDELTFVDARGRHRSLYVSQRTTGGFVAIGRQSAWVLSGTELRCVREGIELGKGLVGRLPAKPQRIRVVPGEQLLLTANTRLGQPEIRGPEGELVSPARIGCTRSDVFRDARVGQRIIFDEGRIAGVIRERADGMLGIEITETDGLLGDAELTGGVRIRLPDTELEPAGLTDADRANLGAIIAHADLLGVSFVRSRRELELVQDELARRGATNLGLVLEIETRRSLEHLPELLLTAMRSRAVGVLVAHAELRIELGLERLSLAEEELLRTCEAAHVPVIWATEALERPAERLPRRGSDRIDLATTGRAACVMLSASRLLADTVRELDDVAIRRSEDARRHSIVRLRKAS
ncbi:pyruvate kinase [Myxococcota bacterium]|nr:pyruvate kinase [Myxococcota bacterium]